MTLTVLPVLVGVVTVGVGVGATVVGTTAIEPPTVGMMAWPAGGPPTAEPLPLSVTLVGVEAVPPLEDPELAEGLPLPVLVVVVLTAMLNSRLAVVVPEVLLAATAKRYEPAGSW